MAAVRTDVVDTVLADVLADVDTVLADVDTVLADVDTVLADVDTVLADRLAGRPSPWRR